LTTGLVMAGGRGDRMRASGMATPKPLVTIAGRTLLEHNLVALLDSGVRDIVVVSPVHTPEIAEFVRGPCRVLVSSHGGDLRLYEESQPLGNIGAASEIDPRGRELLVVFADNLTTLDLASIIRHHRHTGAALTMAVHSEPFRTPFGEVEVRDGVVVSYTEKPERRILISSGVVVLSARAIARIPRGQPTGISWLANQLIDAGERIAALTHEALWIDVNDLGAAARAGDLLAGRAAAD
jgi:NDP-sugar pyrophosphorylase family protein